MSHIRTFFSHFPRFKLKLSQFLPINDTIGFGGKMGKVLDITERLSARKDKKNLGLSSKAPVLDMTEARQAIMSRERRQVKRTILTEFIAGFIVLPERGLLKVSLYDISDNGISFDVELAEGIFTEGEEIAMRIYLSHKTYFPFVTKITNSRVFDHEGIVRHGANFMKGTVNDVALHHLVRFIETVSASLRTDDGDIQVPNIS